MAVVITREILSNARTYMPIAAKERLAEEIAEWTVKPVELFSDEFLPGPPVYKENRALKHMFLMGLLCRYYLQIDFEVSSIRLIENGVHVGDQPIDFYPTQDAYDELASSAIMNQLERLKKSEKDISNIIFDFLYDFKILENMVNGEIKDYIAQKNDVVTRLMETLGMITSETNLKDMSERLSVLQEELSKRKESVVMPDV